MTKDYREMSETELVKLKQKIEKELAERKPANVSEKPPSEKPRVKKPMVKAPPFDQMTALFCRKCAHSIWLYISRSSEFLLEDVESQFYVRGRGDRPQPVTHCPNCNRKLSRGRLRFSEEIENLFHNGSERSHDSLEADGMILYQYCVECGHKIGLLEKSDPPRFLDEADRQKPIEACPSCHTPLREADDVDFNNEQRARLASVYRYILQRGERLSFLKSELAQLFEKIRAKKSDSLEGVKAIIGIYTAWHCKEDKTYLKEPSVAKGRDYCETNGLEVIEELAYSYNRSHRKLKVDRLLQREVGAIVASMNWLTSHGLDEAVEFVRELEQAGIHLELIAGEDREQD